MHFCTNCGVRHDENADFCTNCGERIVSEINALQQVPEAVYSEAAPEPPETQPTYSDTVPEPPETQPLIAPPACEAASTQPEMIQPEYDAFQTPETQPTYSDTAPEQPKNRKKSDLPRFLIPASVAVFLLSACALLFLFSFILEGYTNGDEAMPPIIESFPPVTEITDTPKPTETPDLIETPAPAPTETPDDPITDDIPDATQASFTGKASDYAEMPKTYGEARNLLGYTILDAKDVTYDNFLKLEVGMSLSDIMDILSDTKPNQSEYLPYLWKFSSNPTVISVEIDDDKVTKAEFLDPFRICVDPADISMSAFLQIKIRMPLDDVTGLLGGNYFISAISAKSAEATTLTWYCNEGEIKVIFNTSNLVTTCMQTGFQLYPDARMNYDVLTNRQILDNFQKVSLGITYPELEELMENYVPLCKTEANSDRNGGTEETYEFKRGFRSNGMSLRFEFQNGILYAASSRSTPNSLLTTTDLSSALQIEKGMSYSEVVEILGEGYRIRVSAGYRGSVNEEYKWLLPGDYYNIQLTFEDGFVYYEPYIYYED